MKLRIQLFFIIIFSLALYNTYYAIAIKTNHLEKNPLLDHHTWNGCRGSFFPIPQGTSNLICPGINIPFTEEETLIYDYYISAKLYLLNLILSWLIFIIILAKEKKPVFIQN